MSISISEIVRDAETHHLGIPEVQRDSRWGRTRVRLLMDSLYRGFPVGRLTIWKPSAATEIVARSAGTGLQPTRWVLDGQQRITALCVLFGKRPYWSQVHADFKVQFNPDTEEFRCVARDRPAVPTILDPSHGRRRRAIWVDVADLLNGDEDVISALVERLSNEYRTSVTYAVRMHRLCTVRDRILSVDYTDLQLEDLADAFVRINA